LTASQVDLPQRQKPASQQGSESRFHSVEVKCGRLSANAGYVGLQSLISDSHRTARVPSLRDHYIGRPTSLSNPEVDRPHRPFQTQKEAFMYDLAYVALGLGLIGLLCAYATALKHI
jgi:hypothetical protein